jgi:hypothetical protein
MDWVRDLAAHSGNNLQRKNLTLDRLKQRIGKKILAAAASFRLGRILSTLGLATQLDFEKRIFLIQKTSKPALVLALWQINFLLVEPWIELVEILSRPSSHEFPGLDKLDLRSFIDRLDQRKIIR